MFVLLGRLIHMQVVEEELFLVQLKLDKLLDELSISKTTVLKDRILRDLEVERVKLMKIKDDG